MIPLGSLVKDKVTGFQGYAVTCIAHMNDCVRYGVQPPANNDGRLPEIKYIDGPNIAVLAPPNESLPPAIETSDTFKLGVKLQDLVTGLSGIAVVRMKTRHAGDRYGIQPPVNEKGEIPDVATFDERDLVQIDPPAQNKKRAGKEPPAGPHDPNIAIAR